jgi:flagellar hook assembly protein FlgD
VDGDRIAWIDGRNVARIAALPIAASPDRPRYLGDAVTGAASKDLAKTPWRAFIPVSAALTSCTVTIRRGMTVVQTLKCASATAKQGDAVVSWNGQNSAGKSVKAATYTWILHARDSDGSAVAADGSHAAISGTITVH